METNKIPVSDIDKASGTGMLYQELDIDKASGTELATDMNM